jgi:hypothetical protein
VDTIEDLIRRVQKTRRGFLDIQKAADDVVDELSAIRSLRFAKRLFASEIYQVRSLATFVLGRCAANSSGAVDFLRRRVSRDSDWRVAQTHKLASRACAAALADNREGRKHGS